MALIKLSPEDQAEGVLADIYQATKERMGFLPNSIKLFAHNIGVLLGTLKIFEAYTEGSNINPEIFTLIRYSVAHARGSKYCINMNSKSCNKLASILSWSIMHTVTGHSFLYPTVRKSLWDSL